MFVCWSLAPGVLNVRCSEFVTRAMPSQRLIRKQSLAQRLSSYPQDLLLSLNETYELLEWDTLSDKLSIPVGLALNAFYILARLDRDDQTSPSYDTDIFEGSRIRGSNDVFEGRSGALHRLVHSHFTKLMIVVPV